MIPIPLDQIIQAIASFASPIIKDKIQRNETVVKLLQQFKLNPEHPPSDFTGVYVYSLVEYGVDRPKPLLEIFRREEIKQAFRQAFDHNNHSILLSEVDKFLDTYAIGDEVRDLGLDIQREVAQFATVFIEVAKRSRTPGDVLMSHQLGSLHEKIVSIQEQFNRLITLEGIRTEIARLAEKPHPALPETSASTENNCKAIALAQQMRGWFETLGYRFEKNYEIWQDTYFEWIINIPARRNRYDRILVRGIAGETGFGDVMALRQSVETQRTDEGWLITARRISRAARDEVGKEENRHVGCYTFDELLAQDADFNGYLDWLEAEVKRRKIDTNYVPLSCKKEEIDPITKRQIAVSRYDEQDGWIDGYIDRWLDDPAKEHISILGEFGTGKTWFALHYAWMTLQRYRDAQKRGTELPRLPLVIPLRDYAKAVSVESLFSEFFFRQYKIPLPHYDAFVQLNRMGKLLLIFDGFDEMAARVDRQEMINNFWELAKVVVPGAKVILTCRTEHFPEAKEGRALLNAELQASTANLTGDKPQFEVLELDKFNNDQLRQVLSYYAETTTVERIMGNPQLLDLARRPVMTELILEALPEIEAGKPVDMSRVYLYAVRRKMERDIKAERTFTSLADKLHFLCELSWEMLSTNQMSLNYRLFPDRIRRLFSFIVQEQKNLDHWHYDMMGQTMLIRNADGDYTPAHRSLLEFFVAYKLAASLGALASDFTELAQAQSCLDTNAAPAKHTWSSYFSRHLDETGHCVAIPPLQSFTSEPFEKLRETFGKAPLTKAVMDLLLPMIDVDAQASIINTIEATRGKREAEVDYIGGNAATLAVRLDRGVLEGRNLSHAVILSADFTDISLRHVNFTKANLANSVFTKIFGFVLSVTYSPDGKLLAIGDDYGVIRLWDAANRRELWSCQGHSSRVNQVAFSPDSLTLASVGNDQVIKLWNVQSYQLYTTLFGHKDKVNSIAFSPNGQILASASSDKTVKLWNVHTRECLSTFQGHTRWVLSVAFSSNGEILASTDQIIKLWDIQTGKLLKDLQGHTASVLSVAFSLNGRMLASASSDKSVKLWDYNANECIHTLEGHTDLVRSVAFSPDSQTLASGSNDQTVKLWSLLTGECLNTLYGHTGWVRSVNFSPNGKTLASASSDQSVRLWENSTGECLNILQGYNNRVNAVTFSLDGRTIASGCNDKTLKLWDARTGKCFKNLYGHTGWVRAVAFSPHGNMLASVSHDETVRLWDTRNYQCVKIMQQHSSWIYSVAFSPNAQTLATTSADKTIKLWNISNGECIATLQGHTHWVRGVAFSPDGQIIASVSNDKTVRIWDVFNARCLNIFSGHRDWVRAVTFSPDGQTLATCSDDYTIILWNFITGEILKVFEGHTERVRAVIFSPDGQILASASSDQTVKLWNISNGKCFKTFEGHTDSVISVAFSPDGQILASCGKDETIKLWNITSAECLNTLKDRPYEGMNITGTIGLTEGEKATLKALGALEEIK